MNLGQAAASECSSTTRLLKRFLLPWRFLSHVAAHPFQSPYRSTSASLNLVVRFDDSGISVARTAAANGKSVTWAQLASLADETEPVVGFVRLITGHEF